MVIQCVWRLLAEGCLSDVSKDTEDGGSKFLLQILLSCMKFMAASLRLVHSVIKLASASQ
jgi:hypothetical protein